MSPEEVSAELVELGREALYKHMAAGLPPVLLLPTYEARARAVLAAVLPLHEKQVRERVAASVRAEHPRCDDGKTAFGGPHPWCGTCGKPWPCPTVAVLDAPGGGW